MASKDTKADRPVTIAIIGCGQRGNAYADYALQHPNECQIIAIAEPRPQTRMLMATKHSATLRSEYLFNDWHDLIKTGTKICDAAVVAVHDSLHAEVVIALAGVGYDILSEKPMATNVEDCLKMFRALKDAGIIFGMGHVMRYSPYSKAITDIIESGKLGKLINATQLEPVGYYHFAHSYVRGNWHSEEKSCFSLMTKCCHDIDLLCRWMRPAKPAYISSFGTLSHFRHSEKPVQAGAAERCLDCKIQNECPFSATKIYLDRVKMGCRNWPVSPLVDGIPDIENISEALQTGPYGVCVYESPNDVVDHQVVILEFTNGATVSFTMAAFTEAICEREVRLNFSHGQILGDMKAFTVHDFQAQGKDRSILHRPANEGGGHGGGDNGLMRSFVAAVKRQDQTLLNTDVQEVLDSHLVVFAAEQARKSKLVIDFAEYERDVWQVLKD